MSRIEIAEWMRQGENIQEEEAARIRGLKGMWPTSQRQPPAGGTGHVGGVVCERGRERRRSRVADVRLIRAIMRHGRNTLGTLVI